VLVAAFAVLAWLGSAPVVVAVAMAVWGIVGFGLVPSLQYRVVSLAGPGRDLASTLPASAVTAGIAVGALIGGWAVRSSGGQGAVLTGLIVCAIAVPLTWATGLLRPPAESDVVSTPPVADATAVQVGT
jgi:DHA1 family inner membrane transport protein